MKKVQKTQVKNIFAFTILFTMIIGFYGVIFASGVTNPPTIAATVTGNTTSTVSQGDNVSITITTTDIPDGTEVRNNTLPNGITRSVTTPITITNNTATVVLNIDNTATVGAHTIEFTLYDGSGVLPNLTATFVLTVQAQQVTPPPIPPTPTVTVPTAPTQIVAGEQGTIAISTVGIPANASISINAGSVFGVSLSGTPTLTLDANGNGTASLTIQTSPNTQIGTHVISLTVGSATANFTINVTSVAQTVNITPQSVNVIAGNTTTPLTITTTNINNGTVVSLGNVTGTVQRPVGVSIQQNNPTIQNNTATINIVTTANTPTGSHSITVIVGGVSTTFNLIVAGQAQPTISIGNQNPNPVIAGNPATFNVTTQNIPQGSTISLSGLPAGAAIIGTPLITQNGNATVVISTLQTAASGTYNVTLTVAGQSQTFTLVISGATTTPPPAPPTTNASIVIGNQIPNPASPTATNNATANFSIATQNIAVGSAITISGLPAGTSLSGNPVILQSGITPITINVTNQAPNGTHTVTLNVAGHTQNFTLTVNNPNVTGGGGGNVTTGNILVSFNLNGGSINGSTANISHQVASGTTLQNASNTATLPTRAGLTFNGWYSQTHGRFVNEIPATLVTNGITLTASWIPQNTNSTNLIFNSQGGTLSLNSSANLTMNLRAGTTLANMFGYTDNQINTSSRFTPFRTGHSFSGWFIGNINNNNRFSVNTPITNNITLNAGWNLGGTDINNIGNITIHFNPQGGNWEDTMWNNPNNWNAPWNNNWNNQNNWNNPWNNNWNNPNNPWNNNWNNPWNTNPWNNQNNWNAPTGTRTRTINRHSSFSSHFNRSIAQEIGTLIRPGYIFEGWFVANTNNQFTNNTIVNPSGYILNVNARWAVDPNAPNVANAPNANNPWPSWIPPSGNQNITMPAQPPVVQPGVPVPTVPTPTPTVVQPTQLFPDVPISAWFAPYVATVTTRGLFQGMPDGNFMPNTQMTRAMFIQVIYNIAGMPAVSVPQTGASQSWYTTAVTWATNNGILTQIPNGNVSTPITREEMATLLIAYANSSNINLPFGISTIFLDQSQISTWATSAVTSVQTAGIMQGRPNGNFDPQATATRAEVAALFSRFLNVAN
ncbi:MAG: S-layer homology domain-containing protein [Defluviitaleaceae bacterium]|nr:S-layer homology domain-containing protein [Defluviitaleaceae bacterium]